MLGLLLGDEVINLNDLINNKTKYAKKFSKGKNVTFSNVKELYNLIENKTFSPSEFKNGIRKNENWVGSNVIVFDLDGVDDEIKNLSNFCKEFEEIYGFKINIGYKSVNHSKYHPKFRILLVFKNEITSQELYKAILKSFHESELFKSYNVDVSCSDFARMYFPGRDYELISDEFLDNSLIYDKILVEENRLSDNDLIKVSVESLDNKIRKKRILSGVVKKGLDKKSNYNFDNLKELAIVRDFYAGKKFNYRKLFCLATIFNRLEGGLDHLKLKLDDLVNNSGINYNQDDYRILETLQNVKYSSYLAVELRTLSEEFGYEEDYLCYETTEKFLNETWNGSKYNKLRSYGENLSKKVDLYVKENRLKDRVESYFNSLINNRELVKCETGIGKTELYVKGLRKWLDENNYISEKMVVVLPTHELIREVLDRLEFDDVDVKHVFYFPEIPKFVNKVHREKLQFLYSIEAYDQVIPYLRTLLIKGNLFINEKESVSAYIEAHERFFAKDNFMPPDAKSSNRCNLLFITQARFRTLKDILPKMWYKSIIFDEDPSDTLLQLKKIHAFEDYYRFLLYAKGSANLRKSEYIASLVNDFEEYVITSGEDRTKYEFTTDKLHNMPEFEYNECKMMLKSKRCAGFHFPLLEMCAAKKICFDFKNCEVNYISITKVDLNVYYKSIIFTATPQYGKLAFIFGDEIVNKWEENEETGEYIEHNGEVMQYCGSRYTKSWLRNNISKLKLEGYDLILTHKELEKDGKCYFGNTLGIDKYKGKKIAVVGTYTPNGMKIRLLREELGDVNISRSKKIIRRYGMMVGFMCYDDEKLRKLELEGIESEMLQSIGRARSLREIGARVDVYSNSPLNPSFKRKNDVNDVTFTVNIS